MIRNLRLNQEAFYSINLNIKDWLKYQEKDDVIAFIHEQIWSKPVYITQEQYNIWLDTIKKNKYYQSFMHRLFAIFYLKYNEVNGVNVKQNDARIKHDVSMEFFLDDVLICVQNLILIFVFLSKNSMHFLYTL